MTVDEKVAAFVAIGDDLLNQSGKKGVFTVTALKDRGFRVFIEIFGGKKGGFALDNKETLKDFERKFIQSITAVIK